MQLLPVEYVLRQNRARSTGNAQTVLRIAQYAKAIPTPMYQRTGAAETKLSGELEQGGNQEGEGGREKTTASRQSGSKMSDYRSRRKNMNKEKIVRMVE